MNELWSALIEPLQYPFMVRGLAAGVVVGILCAVVGTFVVLRGMAFLGDALAHTILPGVAAGYLWGRGARMPIFWGSLAAAVAASLGIGFISRRARLREDAAIGVVFAGMFALGIAMISSAGNSSVDLSHILFGDILGVGPGDLLRTALVAAGALGIVAFLYKELLIVTFDPILASTLRLPSAFLYYLQMLLLAVVIVVALQTVGVALMVAMLITPPAAARLLTRRVAAMMGLAAAIGAGSAIVGLYGSYYFGVASGAAIVLVATAVFLLALAARALLRRRAAAP